MELKVEYRPGSTSSAFFMRSDSRGVFDEVARCKDEQFSEEFSKVKFSIDQSIMPPAVRYVAPNRSIILFERPPSYSTLHFSSSMQSELSADHASARSYRLPLPWQRYVMVLSPEGRLVNIFMFFAKDQIRSLFKDRMYLAPIHNFYKSGRLCMASFTSLPDIDPTIFGAVNNGYDMIWGSGYNADTNQAQQRLHSTTRPDQNPLVVPLTNSNFTGFYDRWACASLDEVMSWEWSASWESFFDLLANPNEIYYDSEPASAHDILVKMMFAAQDAAMG